METTSITEFNKEQLIKISTLINFSDLKDEPVVKHVTFENFSCIGSTLYSLLSAIESLGIEGNQRDLATCVGLAEIAKKLLPFEELNFLDKLLVEKERLGKKVVFTPIENLNNLV